MSPKRLALSIIMGLLVGTVSGVADAVQLLGALEMFFNSAELSRTVAWTVGMNLGAGVLFALVAGVFTHGFETVYARLGWQGKFWPTVSGVTLFAAIPVFLLLNVLTSGPQASQIPGRTIIVVGVTLISVAALGLALAFIIKLVARGRPYKIGASVGALLCMVAIYYVDVTVLVRLYSAFHYGLTFVAFVIGWFLLYLVFPYPKRWQTIVVAFVLGLAALGFSGYAISKTLGAQNPRFVIGETTANGADIVALALKVASPPPDKILDDDVSAPETTALVDSRPTLTLPDSDLFLITVDAMRYDRLSLIGQKRSVAPNIDALSKESVVFSRTYTPVPHTSYAITSLLTGKYTKPLFDVPGAPAVHETWPEILRRFRYESSAFFTPSIFFIDRVRFEPYLRKGAGFLYRHADSRVTASERVDLLIEHLEKKKENGRPHFSWMHFFDPHEPYEPVCPEFGDSPMDRYDCEIRHVDEALGKLFEYLKAERPKAIIIVTSDHGEEFGDHGGKYHGSTLYDEQVRVPMVFHAPTVSPKIVDEPVNLVDLLGTTLRILDIPVPARVRSRDLTPLLTGEGGDFDAFAQAHDEAMVVYDHHKIICDVKKDLCRLYDLKNDPQERRSIAGQKPELLNKLRKRLHGWLGSHARFELRPIVTKSGLKGWPEVIQQAIAGDEKVLPELVALIGKSKEPRVRQKAAQLIFEMAKGTVEGIGDLSGEQDDVVAAWLLSHKIKCGQLDELPSLGKRSLRLKQENPVFRIAILTRMDAGDQSVAKEILEIALDESVDIEQRKKAVQLLSQSKNKTVGGALIPLINVYQLTLDVAKTMGALKTRVAVDALVKRLKRERFSERKAAIMEALAQIGDKGALADLSAELFNDSPPPGSLRAIGPFTTLSNKPKRLPLKNKNNRAYILKPVLGEEIEIKEKAAYRVIVQTKAKTAGGSVVVNCNKKEIGRIPLFAGENEGSIDTKTCVNPEGGSVHLQMKLEPDGVEVETSAMVVLSASKEP